MTVEQQLAPPAVDVAFVGGAIVLSFDLAGLPYPIEIDPPIDVAVAANADDDYVRRQTTTTWVATGTGCLAGNINATNYGYGASFRFTGINIPSGATVTVAYLDIVAQASLSTTVVRSDLTFENASNPAQMSSYANHTGRTRATPVAWDGIGAWTAGGAIQTPSMVSPLQAVVDAQGGTGDACMAFWEDKDLESDTGAYRVAAALEHASYAPVSLHAEWTTGGGNPWYAYAQQQ